MRKEVLFEMLETPSVSGDEYRLQKKMKKWMEEFAQVSTDSTGNVYGRIEENARQQVLLSGHIDEIGMMVSDITKDGFLRIIPMGGIMCQQYLGQKVRVWTKKGVIYGAVVNSHSLMGKDVKAENIWIDLGCSNKQQAEELVSIGDRITFDTDVRELQNECITARAMDDRSGAFVVMEALKKAKELGCTNGVITSSSCGEETNMRGAYSAAATFQPTCAIAVDVTYTYDYPLTEDHVGEVNVNGGPVLCMSPLCNPRMNELLKESADRLGIHVQWEVAGGRTGTDADKMFYTGKGVPVALVSIPLRYMHSPDEVGSLKDIRECIDLIADFVCHLDEHETFSPFE